MISEWTVALPKKLKKQFEYEVINQNINLQTAVIESIDLWIKSPVPLKRSLKDIDLDRKTLLEVKTDKQCLFVDRNCLREQCVGWIQNDCFIYLLASPTIQEKFNKLFTDTPGKKSSGSLRDSLEELEKQLIEEAMDKAADNQTRAAEILGMSERMLRYKLKKYDLKH